VPESRSRKKPAYVAPVQAGAPKVNPRWLVPLMITLMVVGLLWIVATYLLNAEYPVPGIGQWNLLIGFVLIIAGFTLTTRWH
jgi:hypothetical protein